MYIKPNSIFFCSFYPFQEVDEGPGQLQEGTVIFARLLTVPLWLENKLLEAGCGSQVCRKSFPARGEGRDIVSTKIRDHKMVLQENVFLTKALGSGELH